MSVVETSAVSPDLAVERALRTSTRTAVRAMGIRMAGYAIGFGASVLIARALGPGGRGQYALPLAVLGVVMAVGHLGLEQSNVFLAGHGVASRTLWANATLAAVLISLAGWGIFAAVVAWMTPDLGGLPGTWFAVALGQIPLLLLILFWSGLLQIEDRYAAVALASLAGIAIHALIVTGFFLAGWLTPFRVLVLTYAVNGITWLGVLALCVRARLVSLRVHLPSLRRGVSFGIRVHVGMLAFFLVLRVDQLLVRGFVGFRALGLYSLAVALGELLWLLTDPLAVALLPHQVRARGDDDRRLAFAVTRLSLAVSTVTGALTWVVAPHLIRVVYGAEFEDATWMLRWLLPGIVALAASRSLWAVLLRDGRAAFLSLVGMSALALNVGVNLALLPSVGAVGASVASSIAYVVMFLTYVAATLRPGVVGWHDVVPGRHDFARLRGAMSWRRA